MKNHKIIIALLFYVWLAPVRSFCMEQKQASQSQSWWGSITSWFSPYKKDALTALAASTAYLVYTGNAGAALQDSKKAVAGIAAGAFVLSQLYNSWAERRRQQKIEMLRKKDPKFFENVSDEVLGNMEIIK